MAQRRTFATLVIFVGWLLAASGGHATDTKTAPAPKPEAPKPEAPAKELFGAKKLPADLRARSIGFYAKGCLAGGAALPINGKTWQVMRLSRNRNWGHPNLVAFLERLADKVPKIAGWPGLLVGDLAQPRGGPMLTGHASHQIGLDADIWLTPMPDRILTPQEREDIAATKVVAADGRDVDPLVWTAQHGAVIKAAAKEPEVERIFVNAAIKKALCREAGSDRGWLHKVRPYWQHTYHFHVRMRCPKDNPDCTGQPPAPASDGCAPADLAFWFSDAVLHPKPKLLLRPKRAMKLAELPPACRQVLLAP